MYNVGDTVDLTCLNRKAVAPASRKSFVESVKDNLQEIGTSYIFKESQEGLKAFRIIPVATA
jgi:hypothetical protein